MAKLGCKEWDRRARPVANHSTIFNSAWLTPFSVLITSTFASMEFREINNATASALNSTVSLGPVAEVGAVATGGLASWRAVSSRRASACWMAFTEVVKSMAISLVEHIEENLARFNKFFVFLDASPKLLNKLGLMIGLRGGAGILCLPAGPGGQRSQERAGKTGNLRSNGIERQFVGYQRDSAKTKKASAGDFGNL